MANYILTITMKVLATAYVIALAIMGLHTTGFIDIVSDILPTICGFFILIGFLINMLVGATVIGLFYQGHLDEFKRILTVDKTLPVNTIAIIVLNLIAGFNLDAFVIALVFAIVYYLQFYKLPQ